MNIDITNKIYSNIKNPHSEKFILYYLEDIISSKLN